MASHIVFAKNPGAVAIAELWRLNNRSRLKKNGDGITRKTASFHNKKICRAVPRAANRQRERIAQMDRIARTDFARGSLRCAPVRSGIEPGQRIGISATGTISVNLVVAKPVCYTASVRTALGYVIISAMAQGSRKDYQNKKNANM